MLPKNRDYLFILGVERWGSFFGGGGRIFIKEQSKSNFSMSKCEGGGVIKRVHF